MLTYVSAGLTPRFTLITIGSEYASKRDTLPLTTVRSLNRIIIISTHELVTPPQTPQRVSIIIYGIEYSIRVYPGVS